MSTYSKTMKFRESIIVTEENFVELFSFFKSMFGHVECSFFTQDGVYKVFNDAKEMYSSFPITSIINTLSLMCWVKYSKNNLPKCVLKINRVDEFGTTGYLSINNLDEKIRLRCEKKVNEYFTNNVSPYHLLHNGSVQLAIFLISSIITSGFLLILCQPKNFMLNKLYLLISSFYGGAIFTVFGIMVIGFHYPKSIICLKEKEKFFESRKRLLSSTFLIILIFVIGIIVSCCLYSIIEFHEL